MYAEVLLVISSFENGVGFEIQKQFAKTGSLLTVSEVENIINELAQHPTQTPYLNDARTKMKNENFDFKRYVSSRIFQNRQERCRLKVQNLFEECKSMD